MSGGFYIDSSCTLLNLSLCCIKSLQIPFITTQVQLDSLSFKFRLAGDDCQVYVVALKKMKRQFHTLFVTKGYANSSFFLDM